ncbi:MAG: hypothetical protein J7521_10430 [Caulobacter sp.]|nr:hypothetical protein [Caulobacter sp.]
MGRGDVIEVSKAGRPPDAMVSRGRSWFPKLPPGSPGKPPRGASPGPGRPNVWSFHTALSPDQVGAHLARGVGREGDDQGPEPIVGVFRPGAARLHRRPTASNKAKLPMGVDWAAEGEGSRVTCRMRPPPALVLVAGAWLAATMRAVGDVPGAIMALALHQDHLPGRSRDTPLGDLIDAVVMLAVAFGGLRIVRGFMDRDRVFLLDHVTRALEAGAVRGARE